MPILDCVDLKLLSHTHTHIYIYIFGVNQHIFIVGIVSPQILCKSNTLVSNVLI